MALERTFSIIKPDAVETESDWRDLLRFEKWSCYSGSKNVEVDGEQAGGFYAEHDGKPFYEDLCSMMSGPVMVQVLEGEDVLV